MSELTDKDKENVQPTQPQRTERDIPLDTRLLSEAVIELNISRKNVGIYPPGHIQITKSIDRAFEILQKLFEIRAEMTLGIAKDTLFVGQDYLDQTNPVYRDFALSLSQQEIATVTFIRDLKKDELVRFHRILTTRPEDIRASGGITKVMADADIPHIRIQVVDYSSFHATEEQEIFRAPGKETGEKSGSDLWREFITHLSAGTVAGKGEQGISLQDAEKTDPAELARFLNERKIDSNAALQSYDRIISEHVRELAEKKELTSEQSATIANLSTLLRDLHPELRKQFLSITLRRMSTDAALVNAGALLGGFQDDMVIEMLKQASDEGRQISPTLAGLLGQLTKAQAQSAVEAGSRRINVDMAQDSQGSPVILPEHMETLFDREKYEEYVTEDYEALLKRLSEGPGSVAEQLTLDEYTKMLEESNLDFQIGRALLAFMEENIDEDDYKEFANKLIAVLPGFLETGNFFLLWDIFETLKRHATEKSVKGIRECAEESQKAFFNPEFVSQTLNFFEVWMKDKGKEAAGFIQALGPITVPGLMVIFSRSEPMGGSGILLNLLCIFGEATAREAQNRLRDPQTRNVKNILLLLRRVGSQASIPFIKPLLHHREQAVSMEALSTLLKLKDPEAVRILRDLIHSEDPDIASQSISLAGQYRVPAATEDILSKVKRAILFETDYAENEEIIKALGEIGDPRAIPELEKLARATWSLYPKSLLRMKEVLFESLERYPRERIGNLLTIGARLESDTIKRICRKLTERK